jgi:hypothetical protein
MKILTRMRILRRLIVKFCNAATLKQAHTVAENV